MAKVFSDGLKEVWFKLHFEKLSAGIDTEARRSNPLPASTVIPFGHWFEYQLLHAYDSALA